LAAAADTVRASQHQRYRNNQPDMSKPSRNPRRLLSIGHSYCVALNRRLPAEMQRAAGANWSVTTAAPAHFHGDLRPITLEPQRPDEPRCVPLRVHFGRHIHVMAYESNLRALLRQPWDVIHVWEEPYILAGSQIAALTPHAARLVYASAQNIAKRYPPPFNLLERYTMQRAAGWIGFGETVAATLRRKGVYSDRPHRVIPLGVDTSVFRPRPELAEAALRELGWERAEDQPVVGYLGRFVAEKGLRLLMRALDGAGGKMRALFVGGGPLEDELRQWAGRHGQRVRILTGVRHDEVPRWLNAMDILCAPSQTTARWREQFGRMLIEAFASGVAVIASDSGEIPHVMGDAGMVVGEADESGWAAAVGELIGNERRRRELAERGLERARQCFAWPVVARQHLEFFAELAGA